MFVSFEPYTKTCLDTDGKKKAKASYILVQREYKYSFKVKYLYINYVLQFSNNLLVKINLNTLNSNDILYVYVLQMV